VVGANAGAAAYPSKTRRCRSSLSRGPEAVGELAAGTSQQAVASGPDGLLTTKLYVPRPPPGFVARSRLVDRLNRGRAASLTLVCAPAGFGKTSVLADWSRLHAPRVGWLSLDTGDNDPVRFWRHITAALNGLRPGIAARVAALLGSPGLVSFDGLVTTIVNELAADPDELLLVLDDYHVIETESVHASLLFLVEHAPPGLHVVLASRADPPLPLARLRAQGQLAELRAADLRFTAEEAAVLLRELVGQDLHGDAVATLAARTEGWAVGLQLAALSLRDQSDVNGFVETFSGSNRYVLDYFTEEVLERQPEPVRAFLLETSVLERLSGPLCDAITDRTDSQAMLETIEKANLFLVPLDEVRGWWRNHQLFADLLRARLQQRQPERVFELHRNAARWHEEHGLIDDAMRHATAAGDALWAARLVERHADGLLLRGEETTLQRWLAALPPELASARPRLLLAQTRFVLLEEVESLLDAAERAFPHVADEPYEPSVGRGASRLANVPAMIAVGRCFVAYLRGDGERTMSFASQALAELGEDEWMLGSLARAQLGSAEWLCGRLGTAERTIASSIERWRAAGVHDMVTLWSQYLGQIQRAQGRLDRALATYEQALDLATAPGQPTLPAAGAAYVGMAEVSYQRGELDIASQHLTEGLALCRQFVIPDALANGSATLAWIRNARDDAAGAMDAMAEAERAADPSMTDLLNPVPAQRARLHLAHGDIDAAARWTAERGLSAADEPSYAREPAYLVLARLLLAQDQPEQALALLGRLSKTAAAQARTGSIIEIQALRALALMASGDETGAVAAITEALVLAHPQGYVRVFVDEGPPMATLLGTLLAAQRTERTGGDGVPVTYLGRLMRSFAQDAAGSAPGVVPGGAVASGLVTQLSERELEVLRLLAAGAQNQEIADELYLALNTVKKHVTHIFEKLGAANRTEAAARARELGLLS
jgi:LuxR family transcriptional regulator, maltose regulon positive regulatory protein